jgi:hypothetical protein
VLVLLICLLPLVGLVPEPVRGRCEVDADGLTPPARVHRDEDEEEEDEWVGRIGRVMPGSDP